VRKILERIMEDVRKLIPPTIFFLIAFHILALFRALMLRQYGIEMSVVAGATVGALVVAKVMLIADLLPFVNRFPQKPLAYNVVWKTLIYFVAALVVRYLEHLVPLWWHTHDLLAANRKLFEEIVWPQFWAIQLWMWVLLFAYCAVRELFRAIGADEVKRMYFGTQVKRA